MKQADLLTAAFRQLASSKLGAKAGMNGVLHSKDGKEKAEHFREQMRQVSKGQVPVDPKIDKIAASAHTNVPVFEAADILAELKIEAKPKAVEKEELDNDEEAPKAPADGRQATATAHDFRDPNAAIAAVMSKLDQAQDNVGRDARSASSTPVSHVDPKPENILLDPTDVADVADIKSQDADASALTRFSAVVETADPKPVSMSKPVVREQETHFEPVQQPTTLQKIVDRMASDLPAVASAEPSPAAPSSPEHVKVTESRPVRMMTLELDPPNLGTVTIKMRLAGDSVEVHLTADRLETTNLLRQERGILSDAMQSAGYSFDIAAIDHTRSPDANLGNGQPPSQPQQQQASPDQRGSPSSSSGAQADGGQSGRSSGEGQSGARQNRQDHDQSQTPSERQLDQGARRVRSGTVYL